MKKLLSFFLLFGLMAGVAHAQSFTNMTSTLGASFNSGGCVGVTDMDNDGFDDIIVLHNSRHLRVLYQTPNGWNLVDYGTVSGNNQWGFAIGDISETGHRDVVSGGSYDGVHHVRINAIDDFEMVNLQNGSMFMQACNIADIDNDGHLDYFACHDDALSRMWRNDGSGNLIPGNEMIDLTDYDTGAYPNTDHSGNYGSVWADINDDGYLDLVIAKCRQFVNNPFDPRRINQAWINDGNGNFTEEAFDRGLVLYEQSWTVDFADVNNDGFFDCLITNHSGTMQLLMNDGNGFFEDVTVEAGLNIAGFFLQAKMVDFDNDGWVDLIYSGGVHRYYRNNGDGTFTHVENMFPYSDTMHSFGIGDLNKDGFLDVYASYGNTYVNPDPNNPDILWMNDGNANNWIGFDLEGTESNSDAIGAKAKIYGPWGVQVREVRAGESYGIVNSFHLNFGIGSNEEIELVQIDWPSGNVTIIENPQINTYHQVIEGSCVLAGIEVSATGPTALCPGESVVLNAPEGYSYLWSNGATTPSIEVTQTGFYSVTAFDGEGCAGGSNAVAVTMVEATIPTITVNGDLFFCEGGSVELISSPAQSYTWNNGAENQTLVVTETGTYSVAVVDVCATATESETIVIEVFESPATPDAESPWPSILPLNESEPYTLSTDGENVHWYGSINGGAPQLIATGNTLEMTPEDWDAFGFIPDEICVEDVAVYGGIEANGGKETFTEEGGQPHINSNFWLVFDAHEDIILESVKVFAAGTSERTIALINAQNEVIEQITIEIEEGEQVVALNFDVPEGENYGLRTLDSNPQLWRDGPESEPQYPYAIGDLATITTSSVSGANALNFYYFFYDWKVATPEFECRSELNCEPVLFVSVDERDAQAGVQVYPNPATGVAFIEVRQLAAGQAELLITDASGRAVERLQVNLAGADDRMQLNLTDYATGVYLVTLTQGEYRLTSRLVVD